MLFGAAMAVQPGASRAAIGQSLGFGTGGGSIGAMLLIGLAAVFGFGLGYAGAALFARHAGSPRATASSPHFEAPEADEGAAGPEDEPVAVPGDDAVFDSPGGGLVGGLRGAWLKQTGEMLPTPAERNQPADEPATARPDEMPAPEATPTLQDLTEQLTKALARLDTSSAARANPAAPVPANDQEPPLLDDAARQAVASALARLEEATSTASG